MNKNRSKHVQYFSEDYIEFCKKLTPTQIAQFLDDYRYFQKHEKEKPIKMQILNWLYKRKT